MDSQGDRVDVSSNVSLRCFLANSRGTCAMKSRHEGGVVDKDLNVYGTSSLKIAGSSVNGIMLILDMSITPTIGAAKTASTALVIGEKAVAIIARELGIKMLCFSDDRPKKVR